MIVPKLLVSQLLLSMLSVVKAEHHDSHIRVVADDQQHKRTRGLSHKDAEPAWSKLEAAIEHKNDGHLDVGGSLILEFDEDDVMKASYHIHDLPKYGKSYLAIMDKKSCSGDLDADDHHFDIDVEDDGTDPDPFKKDLTNFVADHNGDAIGGVLGIDNGISRKKNRCKIAVIWTELKVEKSKKSDKSRRMNQLGRRLRELGSKKKTKKVYKILGCGVLKKVGDIDDCE